MAGGGGALSMVVGDGVKWGKLGEGGEVGRRRKYGFGMGGGIGEGGEVGRRRQ